MIDVAFPSFSGPGFWGRLIVGVKAFTQMVWGGGPSSRWGGGNWAWPSLGRTRFSYVQEVGDGRGNAIVVACLNWMGRKFPEAKIAVRRVKRDGTTEDVRDHPMVVLLNRPNPFYSGSLMLVAMLRDWMLTGNGYLLKVRSAANRTVQLWYVPGRMVEPVWESGLSFIDYYAYTPGGASTPFEITPSDVIHMRNGLDPDNVRKGLSLLGALFREIFTDDEAANYTAAVLRNLGVPGVVIMPDGDTTISPDTAAATKASFMSRFGNDHRGEPMVMGKPIKIERVSLTPSELNLRELRKIPEERVTAIFGLPAVVVGMGAGLDRSTFANMAEAREVAVEDNLLPCYRLFADELKHQLLPDFEAHPEQFEVLFDTAGIRELQPDQNKLVEREALRLRSGGITIDEFRTNTGSDPFPNGGDVLLIPATSVPTPLDAIVTVAPPAPTTIQGAGYDSIEVKTLGVLHAIEALRARLLEPETRVLDGLLESQRALTISVLREMQKDMPGVQTKEIDFSHLVQRLESTFIGGVRAILERLHLRAVFGIFDVVGTGLDVSLDVPPALRQRFLREAGANVQGITDTTFGALNRVIRDSQMAGESLDELTARIEDMGVFSAGRARTIARTELALATNSASIEAYDLSGVVRQVRIHDGTHFDEPCASLNGRIVSLAEARGIQPIGHPNCLVGGTLVVAPQVQASFTRMFHGEVVILRTAADDLLTCTANHPILTDHGWVAAGQLREGDYVIHSLDSERISALLDPDHDYMPTLIEDVANTLGPAGGGSTSVVPTSAEDFHGDGADGDVCVVWANGGSEARGRQPFCELTIESANVTFHPFSPVRLFDEISPGFGSPPNGSVGGSSVGLPPIGSDVCIPQATGLGGRTAQISSRQPSADLASIASKQYPNLVRAQLLSDVEITEHGDPRILAHSPRWSHDKAQLAEVLSQGSLVDAHSGRDLVRCLAGLVAPVQLVKVELRYFSGHVFNLETKQGWYIAEGILTHNCSRRFEGLIEPARRSANGNGRVEEKDLVNA